MKPRWILAALGLLIVAVLLNRLYPTPSQRPTDTRIPSPPIAHSARPDNPPPPLPRAPHPSETTLEQSPGPAQATITGTVTDAETGRPIAGATIGYGDTEHATTNAQGHYELCLPGHRALPLTLRCSRTDYEDLEHPVKRIPAPGESDIIDFRLTTTWSLHIQVIPPPGEHLPPGGRLKTIDLHSASWAGLDEQGWYHGPVELVEFSDQAEVQAEVPGYPASPKRKLSTFAREGKRISGEIQLARGGEAWIQLFLENGQPCLNGGSIRLTGAGESRLPMDIASHQDTQGIVTLTGLREGVEYLAHLDVEGVPHDDSDAPLQIHAGQMRVITLKSGVTLTGRVLQRGAPCADVFVHVFWQESSKDRALTRTDAEGRFRITGIPPGRTIRVRVCPHPTTFGGGYNLKGFVPWEGQVSDPTTDLTLTLPPDWNPQNWSRDP